MGVIAIISDWERIAFIEAETEALDLIEDCKKLLASILMIAVDINYYNHALNKLSLSSDLIDKSYKSVFINSPFLLYRG